ncbi:MAG: HAD family phosphatase, partial [Alistipes sp.]|nr:HAD family phosphatase [Alistipes sp.]
MKNIVFDLGGVLFARDRNKCTQEFIDFFDFIRSERLPRFWEEYDRGTSAWDEVVDTLCTMHACPRPKCEEFLRRSIAIQEPVKPTEELIGDLKAAGYALYVLSNMSREFIDFLRRFPVYGLFDGEVVSCEEHVVKPEPAIYRILLERYGL